MKIFYVGSVISERSIDQIVQRSKRKPSVSSVVFEQNLLSGLCTNDAKMTIRSVPPMAMWPRGSMIAWGNRRDAITETVGTRWLPALNIPGLKQISLFFSALFALLGWLILNLRDREKSILTYGVYPPVTAAVLMLSKLFGCKCCAVIADLPAMTYANREKITGIRGATRTAFVKLAVALQRGFSSYVLLTKPMATHMGIADKPHIIVEAIARMNADEANDDLPKAMPPAIMYAGTMNAAYGIAKLIEAFRGLRGEFELWLFGSGDYEEAVIRVAREDPRIRFFGRVDHEKVLVYERRASLLINVRDGEMAYTKYSFPSKTIEYMQSGTAVMSTRLQGIPKEYEPYLYWIDDPSESGIRKTIEDVMHLPQKEREQMALRGRIFCKTEKNPYIQAQRILHMLEDVNGF